MTDYKKYTAPCGIDCFNCEVFYKNITDESVDFLSKFMPIDKKKVACRGCREEEGRHMLFCTCEGYECATKKGLDFCYQCDEFPCERFQPSANGADKYPHNIKMYNLMRIKKVGLKEWAENEAKEIRELYFSGKFCFCTGPKIKEEADEKE